MGGEGGENETNTVIGMVLQPSTKPQTLKDL